jgi:hypothetical protein
VKKIGLIAGNGRFPILLSEEVRKKGYEIVIAAIKQEADEELAKVADKIYWVDLGSLQDVVNVFSKEGVTEILMAGKVTKTAMYSDIKFDERFKNFLENVDRKNDDRLLSKLAEELSKDNINVIDPCEFLDRFLPPKGILTKIEPTESQMEDIDFGFEIAKSIAGLDIGQTVVVKNKVVLAVEAIEGTDKAIKRGAELGNGNVVVAKVSRPKQDMRFDIPVIGLTTIEVLIKNKVSAIVIDSKTVILDMKEVIEKAQKNNIVIVVK